MRKGIDSALFRKVVLDKRTGEVVEDRYLMTRPAHGLKELKRRHAAKKAAKQARKRNRG